MKVMAQWSLIRVTKVGTLCALSALIGWGLGFYLAPNPDGVSPEESMGQDQTNIEAVAPQIVEKIAPEQVSLDRETIGSFQSLNDEVAEKTKEIGNLQITIIGLEHRLEAAEQEVLVSDSRVSALEYQLQQAFLEPEKSALGSFFLSSVADSANGLEKLIVLRTLQDIPVHLTDTEAMWVLQHVRQTGFDPSMEEVASFLGPLRIVDELSSSELQRLRDSVSEGFWNSTFQHLLSQN
jgi:hypothetical protein